MRTIGRKNNDYRFIDKDPVIGVIMGEMARFGNMSNSQIERVAFEAGVAPSTIWNWINGEVRRPQSLSTRFVLEALGVSIKYVRDDGTTIREKAPEMISKTEQEKILKKDREREKAREQRAKERAEAEE